MKRIFLLFICLIFLTSCALSNSAKWHTIEVKKNWPDDYATWTYKRCAGQNLVWALFGNDNNGQTPWFHGKKQNYWSWWFRNMAANLKWYGIGYAWWEEGNCRSSLYTDHLEYKFIAGDWKSKGFRHIGVKPKKRSWFYWRPYFGFHSDFLSGWIGWGRRGQWKASIKRE